MEIDVTTSNVKQYTESISSAEGLGFVTTQGRVIPKTFKMLLTTFGSVVNIV